MMTTMRRKRKGAQGKLGFNTLNKCSWKNVCFLFPQNSKKEIEIKTRDINTPPRVVVVVARERVDDDESDEMPR